MSIESNRFPDRWKTAKVIPVWKGDDKLEANNYRPVSQLSPISRVIEKVIAIQVIGYLENVGLLNPSIHGYRKHHSCETSILEVLEEVAESQEEKSHTAICMYDQSAAFDVVDHPLLLQKLRLYGFDQRSLAWMTSYLSQRYQSVCIDGTLSDPLAVTVGVPQGSILGPLCYIIYTNDLPETIFTCQAHHPRTKKFSTHCADCGSVCCFADDSTLSISHSDPEVLTEKLSEKYSLLSEYLTSNRLKLNDDKTHLILMTTSQNRRLKNPQIQVQTPNETINTSNSEKLLGGFIHEDLKWKEHIVDNENSLIKSLTTRLNALKKMSTCANFKMRLMVANGIFISKLIYLIPLWGGACGYLVKMLQVVQNQNQKVLLKQCNWLSVAQLSAYHSLVTTHKIMLSQEPKYLYNKFGTAYPCQTRLAASKKIRITANFDAELSLAHQSFRWRASRLYNELPISIRSESKVVGFKFQLKQWVKANIDI